MTNEPNNDNRYLDDDNSCPQYNSLNDIRLRKEALRKNRRGAQRIVETGKKVGVETGKEETKKSFAYLHPMDLPIPAGSGPYEA